MHQLKGKLDYSLLLAVLILLVISVTFIYTASSTKALEMFGDEAYFLKRQIVRILLGGVALILALLIDYRVFLRISPWIFWGSLTLLILLLVMPGEWSVRSARRWMLIMGFRFQPSEIAKYGLILMLARILSMPGVNMRSFADGLLPQLILAAAVCGAIMLEPDAGTAIMIFFIISGMLFIAGARIWHLLLIFGGGATAATLLLLSVPYQRERLMSYLEAFQDSSNIGWQVKQSLISLGNGGVFGIGLGQSRQKMHWLPDPFTDFIFSIIGEELGAIGTLLVVFLFLVIIYRGFRIALSAPDKQGQLLAAGITLAIGLYGLMNMAVVLHLLPTTGIPMPFISYGGTSLIMNMFGIGVLLNICQQGDRRALQPVVWRSFKRRFKIRDF